MLSCNQLVPFGEKQWETGTPEVWEAALNIDEASLTRRLPIPCSLVWFLTGCWFQSMTLEVGDPCSKSVILFLGCKLEICWGSLRYLRWASPPRDSDLGGLWSSLGIGMFKSLLE